MSVSVWARLLADPVPSMLSPGWVRLTPGVGVRGAS